ncbi:two-component system, chemotaxis family, response regulator CheB [Actinoplanes utahensis]|uniref:protein-glutamate methylesterase n=2 Tax=Actinoplanes utahensis TaxID=1869 RepID=A0A0A6UGP2_ACTUT|nr:two-component system, chemotaxis family, response regulator CheB [Actinoplanes utahensis]
MVAVGASAGGVQALCALAGGLPAGYPGALLVVLHVSRAAPSALPAILSRSGPLPAQTARDGERVLAGRIYVAPSDHHLLLLGGHLRLSHGPAENCHRPAVDPLFRSVARAAGHRAIGVVLSGSRDDGAAGLAAVAARGGVTVVQDPEDALHPSMPRAAMKAVRPDHTVPAAEIGALLAAITAEPLPPDAGAGRLPAPAGLGCPSCGGLLPLDDRPLPRLVCPAGHAWSPESLLTEQSEVLDGALRTALRALQDRADLGRRMAGGHDERLHRLADDAESAAGTLRHLIARLGATTAE